jgi:hypothetical protein
MSELRTRILLSVQRALLGEVFPALRAVSVAFTETSLDLRFYVDGPADELDRESISIVETEVLADFDLGFRVHATVIELRQPALVPNDGERVFMRRE